MLKKSIITILVLTNFLLSSCENNLLKSRENSEQTVNNQQPINTEKVPNNLNLNATRGQTIYIPVYSYIYYGNKARIYDLTVTVNFQNTDRQNSIILKSVKYYNAKGELIEDFLSQPIKLNPLTSTDFYIDELDNRGGIGDSFLIEWVAETQVSNPVAESVMIGASGTQGISFVSQGRVIKDWNKE